MKRWMRGGISLLALAVGLGAAPGGGVPSSATEIEPIEVGAPLPDARVSRVTGEPVSLREIAGGAPMALIFYRGGW